MKYNRIKIIYAEYGGAERDGIIKLRRGNKECSLEGAEYANVRIRVTSFGKPMERYFMKGIAIYSDDIPREYDAIYYTNKPEGTASEDLFKKHKKFEKNYSKDFNIVTKQGDWKKFEKALIIRNPICKEEEEIRRTVKMNDVIEYKFVTKLLKLHDEKEVYVLNIMKNTKYGAGFLRQHSYDHKPTPHDLAKAIEEYMIEDENKDEEEKGCPNR